MQPTRQKMTTFLTFAGQAEEAMNFYVSLFAEGKILSIQRYSEDEVAAPGKVVHATFSLAGQIFMCMDSNVTHKWTFTPAISLYIACATEAEVTQLFAQLSQGGEVLMPLATYPFSDKFAWVADRYGVSWQLNLERN